MRLGILLGTLAGLCVGANVDVVVVGGTPGGIAAAISAARLGHSVALIEYHNHLGGMSASGLGKSDIETPEAIAGLWREFTQRVRAHYVAKYGEGSENEKLCRNGYFYEPSVAEASFDAMVRDEARITVFKGHRLREVMRSGQSVTALRAEDRRTGERKEFRARVFIDATYEGDLAAYAGAPYRTGREARSELNELHAGVVFQDPKTRTFLAGTTGEGDGRLQAYTYRLCLTDDPNNSAILKEPPAGYDASLYAGYLDDAKEGRMDTGRHPNTVVRAFSIAPIPNRKFDANMYPRALAYPFVELNTGYPDADWEEREKISAKIRNVTLGLLWFMQNDPRVPEDQRKLARQYHLPKDEFRDNQNFPWQLYVREARRLEGEYMLSEHDLTPSADQARPPIHRDSISAGEYPFDSMPARKLADEQRTIQEGYLLMMRNITRPYQIPYRMMVPRDVEGLLVPVAASATHIAFSSIRLEPTWMALGQAAGTAAHLSIASGEPLRKLRPERIQRLLLKQDQVLTFFTDMDKNHPAHRAMQFLGTKGFFRDYEGKPDSPVSRCQALTWISLALRTAGLREALPRCDSGNAVATTAGLRELVAGAGRRLAVEGIQFEGPANRGTLCMVLDRMIEKAGY